MAGTLVASGGALEVAERAGSRCGATPAAVEHLAQAVVAR